MKPLLLSLLVAMWANLAMAADPPKLPAKEPTPVAKAAEKVEVPYRLTDTKHVMVRVKLNGKGPFNFILDTGAPAVFIPKTIAKKIGLELDGKGWGEFKTFQIEGGLTVDKATTRVEDLFQLEGMNGMGLAGVELHGVIGYNVLARFRITYDFTKDKLAWTPLDFDPPLPKGIEGKGGEGQGSLEMMGTVMKVFAGLLGVKPNFEVRGGGLVGAELEEKKDGLYVKSVLKAGPADEAGFKAGDKIDTVKTTSIDDMGDFNRAIGKSAAGTDFKVILLRGGEMKTVTLTLGKGL